MESTFVKEWHNQTTLHPLGLALVLAMGFAVLVLPRRYAVWPMLLIACFVAPAQRLVVLTLDFNLLRLLVLFGWMRVISRGEAGSFQWKPLDALIIAFCAVRTAAAVILYGELKVLVTHLGLCFDVMGMYFLFRLLIRTPADLDAAARGIVWMSLPVALAFAVEHFTARNTFSVFGGVPEITKVRDGRLRCQGAFAHPILAGTFWASVLPLVAAEWWAGATGKMRAVVGTVTSLGVVALCASATPLVGVAAAGGGTSLFLLRRRMRWVLWGTVASLLALHLVMENPVWHLITRVDVVGGSTGYHRYALINGAINHFDEWGLIGSTQGTAHWGYHLFDVTNQYIVAGLEGGLLLLGLFVATLVVAYRGVGRMVATAESKRRRTQAWALGVCLFVHTVSFLGVTYFGQIILIWHLLLGAIGSLTPTRRSLAHHSATRTRPLIRARLRGRLVQLRLPHGVVPAGAAGSNLLRGTDR